ncbi:hypothetical protein C8R45DRAFT_1077248 [Mycena sanguinolenta]|nr:hypothetical protein C8R45DRAFT_1077248 [Mycena sanguinolenta]
MCCNAESADLYTYTFGSYIVGTVVELIHRFVAAACADRVETDGGSPDIPLLLRSVDGIYTPATRPSSLLSYVRSPSLQPTPLCSTPRLSSAPSATCGPADNFPRPQGIEIGDVGAVADDGSFNVFFNIRESADPVNRPNWGLPAGFEEIDFRGGRHSCRNIKFCRTNCSSALTRRRLAKRSTAVEEIPRAGGEARRGLIGYPVENGDLYLITGVDKSTLWNVSATEKDTANDHISLKIKAVQFASVGSSYRWEWEEVGQFSDSGPRPASDLQNRPASDLQNQTVFLRGYKVMLSAQLWRKQKKTKVISVADSKPSDILKGKGFFRSLFSQSSGVAHNAYIGDMKHETNTVPSDNENSVSVSYFPASYQRYHPADVINAHLLAFSSDVSVAVTHDDEWMSVLEEEEEKVPEDAELIRRILLKYSVEVESGRASLKPHTMDPLKSPLKKSGWDGLFYMHIEEFCQTYRLDDQIRYLLDQRGFETAGALFEASAEALRDAGFKFEQIAKLKRALTQFLGADKSEEKESEPIMPTKTPEPETGAGTARTAANMLKFALKQLSSISSSIPIGGILSSIVDPLLDITERIEVRPVRNYPTITIDGDARTQQTSDNAKGLIQLALRIERLTPIVTRTAENDPQKGQGIAEKLQKELASIITELEVARSRGELNQFFNSADNTSILNEHNTALDRLIAECTEIAESFRELSLIPIQVLPVLKGGYGRQGGKSANTGGLVSLGVNGWVQRTNTVQGGFGGGGGPGDVQGGRGGVGQAPKFTKQLIMSGVEGKAYHGPTLSMGDFCQKYHVSDKIRKLLEEEGFETAGQLLEVTDADLREAGLKGGQIAELKRALKDLVSGDHYQ